MAGKVCRCGKGYVSQYDGKCGHCRKTKEQKEYVYKHVRGYYAKAEKETLKIFTFPKNA